MKKAILLFMALFTLNEAFPQVDISYQVPGPEILELADVKAPAYNLVNSKGDYIIQLERNQFKSIEELSATEMRLGGLRINPVTNISSRVTYFRKISILKVGDKEAREIEGLPEQGQFTNFRWSPDESKMAFTHTTEDGIRAWVIDIAEARARKISDQILNANTGAPLVWFRDGKGLLMKAIPQDKKELIDKTRSIPKGPRVSVNEGSKAQNRTYQDLLKDKADEFNFEQLTRSEIIRVDLDGTSRVWMPTAMYRGISFSPDGEYVLVTRMEKPFSYIVPMRRFPYTVAVYTKEGRLVETVLESPLLETLPKGFMAVQEGKRRISWRSDRPATLLWVEALDKGDPQNEVEHRDVVYTQDAPFNDDPVEMIKTRTRFSGIEWGSNEVAMVYDYWWNTRMVRTTLFDPSGNAEPRLVTERNYQDRYNDPGQFVYRKNQWNRNVLEINNGKLYLSGDGYSDEGMRPFVDEFDIATMKKKRLWQADGKKYLEEVTHFLNVAEGDIITRIQSQTTFPNYYVRNLYSKKKPKQITFNKNPFEALKEVEKEVIKYKRDDGIELSATLYLPAGYKMEQGRLPMLMWAYPEEHKDKSTASQVTASEHEFVYPWYGSPIFWVNKGYAVLDDAAFPIIGEGELEPNDQFIPQLVANAKAAIDAVDEMGVVDRERVAVGGHSYGAFMTANLLTHSDLFAAGIARSGAYNRTLTPFGFQSEERNYWEAPNIYYEMSPFMHADKMKHPLLLIHGEADNNSGTYPMQSERYFNALKGLGATVRLVMLPKESHGYSARESILHMLWEQDQWLEKYVKGSSSE